jgi:hypothetical protein
VQVERGDFLGLFALLSVGLEFLVEGLDGFLELNDAAFVVF